MRLTLRTLLAHLHDELTPSEAQEIGEKLQTSPIAMALAQRIEDVLRRHDFAPEELTGPSTTLDSQVVAHYLDNSLPPSQVLEVETACLASDRQLAAVAACQRQRNQVSSAPKPVIDDKQPVPAAAESAFSEQFCYRLFGEEYGPVTREVLEGSIVSGLLGDTDEVRRLQDSVWITVHDFLGDDPQSAAENDDVRALQSLTSPEQPVSAPTDDVTPFSSPAWYCQSDEPLEPRSFDDLLDMARRGILSPDDPIRLGREGHWRRAGSLGRLMAEMPYQPSDKHSEKITRAETAISEPLPVDPASDVLEANLEPAAPALDHPRTPFPPRIRPPSPPRSSRATRTSAGMTFETAMHDLRVLGAIAGILVLCLLTAIWSLLPESTGKFRQPYQQATAVFKDFEEQVLAKPVATAWKELGDTTKHRLEPIETQLDALDSKHAVHTRLKYAIAGMKQAAALSQPDAAVPKLKAIKKNLDDAAKRIGATNL